MDIDLTVVVQQYFLKMMIYLRFFKVASISKISRVLIIVIEWMIIVLLPGCNLVDV